MSTIFRTVASNVTHIDKSVVGGHQYRDMSLEPSSDGGTPINRGARIAFGERIGNGAGTGCYGILYIRFAFNVTIELYDQPSGNRIGKLTCSFPSGAGPAVTPVWANRNGNIATSAIDLLDTGGHFYDAVGFKFAATEGHEQTAAISLPEPNASSTQSMMDAYCNGQTVAQWYFDDNDFSGANPGYNWSGHQGASAWRYLTTDDLGPDGRLKQLVLANLYHRWYDQPNGNARVTGMSIVLNDQISVDWLYYPWAVNNGSKWLTCNRDYDTTPSSNRSAFLRIKESNAWRDVLNNLVDRDYAHDGWIKVNGTWVRSDLYGDNS